MSQPNDAPESRFRCALSAGAEHLAGSAAADAAYLLVEYPGAWGKKALAESALPEHVRDGLAEAADRAGVRVQLIRRHGRNPRGEAFRVFLGSAAPDDAWLETTVLEVADDLLDLDLDGLAEGRRPGLEPHDEPLLLVCTNGRRDACCAEFGRPIVAALTAAHPLQTWETTHVGGHRFAGAMLTLPHGFSYGRLDSTSALAVAASTLAGRLVVEHLRGRTAYAPAVQAAEVALLAELGDDAADALSLVDVQVDEDGRHRVGFRHRTGERVVTVDVEAGPPVRASCADTRVKATKRFVTRVEPSA
ncbi:sucrase ferredoxin [Nocardioides sp. JQ2195]|uniref:sucrase ferredoxin n=1 Tax=Nocardioides sp. JQ2195 TaxID=2592334 RepID=UPI00143E73A5|nr:sucrase ferredoxin [Nocardioides sp. JQ2195]QIX25371.1 sucrase ferredoxin [Nocardioides sp. JQ2195]